MEQIKFEISKHTHTEKLNGREYLVLPSVALIEGVFNGILIKGDELEKSSPMWNGKPVYFEHPWDTVDSKEDYEKHHIGIILSAEYVDSKLKFETWVDKELLNEKEPEILDKLEKGEIEEGSIGFWVHDFDIVAGEYDGKPYYEIDYGIVPDHFALLGEESSIGACSIEDGCGIGRAFNKEDKKMVYRSFNSRQNISQDDIGTGDKIEIDNSGDAAHTGSWGSRDHVADRNTILEASNYKSLTSEMYLGKDEGWAEAPSQKLHYPHHTVMNGELVVSESGVQAARSFLERGDTQVPDGAVSHLKRHYNELGLEWENDNQQYEDKDLNPNLIERIVEKVKSQFNSEDIMDEKKIFEDCETVEDCKKFTKKIEDTGVEVVKDLIALNEKFEINDFDSDTLERLIELQKNVGVEKLEELVGEYEEKQEKIEKETEELRTELIDDFDFPEKSVENMDYSALKETKKFIKDNKNSDKNFLGQGGVRDEGDKEFAESPNYYDDNDNK